MAELPELVRYLDRVSKAFFGVPIPAAPPLPRGEWEAADRGDAASGFTPGGAPGGGSAAPQHSQAEQARSRNSRLWLAGAAAAMLGYMWFSGGLLLGDLQEYLDEYEEADANDDGGGD